MFKDVWLKIGATEFTKTLRLVAVLKKHCAQLKKSWKRHGLDTTLHTLPGHMTGDPSKGRLHNHSMMRCILHGGIQACHGSLIVPPPTRALGPPPGMTLPKVHLP